MPEAKFETIVVHSRSKEAWNIISTRLGAKYKVAIIPYVVGDDTNVNTRNRLEALGHAEFISECLNHYEEVMNKFQ